MRQILVDYVYETMLRRAKNEIKRDKEEETTESGDEVTSTGPPVSDEDALRYIFKQKLQGEKEAESTTDDVSWYTESDRNVHLLLDQKRHGSTGCIWGRMILMRVYENQENMTIQTILRDALQKLGLEAPPRPDGMQPARAFSVLSDIAETVIEDAIEPYFLEHHDLRRSTAVDSESPLWALFDDRVTELKPRDSKAITLSKILADKKFKVEQQVAKGIQMPKAELGYTDLHNLPILLIVTEKARMGDTFPHSLATLDLRMRTGGTLVAFVQELGRMCRYPFTRKLPIESSRLSCAAIPMALPDEVENHPEVTRSFELGLPIIVMPENGQDADIIGHAQNKKELGELVNQLASKYGVGCKFELHGYFDQLPRAIIRTDVMKLLVDGIQVKERKAPKSDLTTALQCVVMKGGMDDYMKPVKAPKDLIARIDGDNNPWHKYYENFLPASHQEDSTSTKTVHYDAGPAACPKHKHRLLLFAECQIGKTGAYLHFITRLREEIRGDRKPTVILEKVDTKWGWHFPYWRNLSNAVLDYKQPKEGHYFEKVAQGRMARLQKLAKEDLMDWASAFCEWLLGHGADEPYGELIVSETGRKKVEELHDKIKDAEIPVMPSGCAKEGEQHEKVLRWCIDWDARMKNVSQLHEKMGDLKDKNYSPANAAFDQVGYAAANAKTPSILPASATIPASATMPSITWARHQPPVCNPADGSLMTRKFTLRKKSFGRNAELCEDADCILHIPAYMKGKLVGVDSGTNDLTASFEGLKVKRWIFTCSSGGADKKQIRLNREPAMKPLHRTEYAQVLVVRPGADVESYVRTWGSQYIVVAMPATMAVKYAHGAHDDVKYAQVRTLRVEVGRIGYARLFCQLLADALNLEEIWMLDDNVERCFTIEMSDANVPAVDKDGVVQLRECGFSNVMRGMELLLDQVREFRTLCATSLRV